MDEELKTVLNEMLIKINHGQERILNRMASLQQDFMNTKGFLVGDAIVSGRKEITS